MSEKQTDGLIKEEFKEVEIESLDSDDEVFKPPPKIWLAIDFGADRTNIAVWSKQN